MPSGASPLRLVLAAVVAIVAATGSGQQQAAAPVQPASSAPSLRVGDRHFFIGNESYRFAGVDSRFATKLGAEGASGDRARLVREVDRLQARGVTNLRLVAASEAQPMRRIGPSSGAALERSIAPATARPGGR